MTAVAFTEFRRNASKILSRVERGETLIVERHGRPIAEVSPVPREEGKVPSWKRPGLRIAAKGARLSAAILEGRDREGLP
jgi:prevent-host-death family protein